MRKNVVLVCTICLSRNYKISINTTNNERFTANKYCKVCKTHTEHKQEK